MYAILGIAALTGLSVLCLRWWKKRRLSTAANWPITEGFIAQLEERRDDNGFMIVTLAYTYKVEDERYVGRESFPFVRDEDAAKFEAGCRQRTVRVHYRPDKPNISVLVRDGMPR
jgi:hypothetical protein